MRIGVPKETKTLEGRVALVPAAAGDLVKRGHEVWIEKDAGVKSGFRDEQYNALGVKIAPDAALSWIAISMAMPSSGWIGPWIACASATASPVCHRNRSTA